MEDTIQPPSRWAPNDALYVVYRLGASNNISACASMGGLVVDPSKADVGKHSKR